MSRLTGEQLYEIMGRIPDEFVTEALPLSLLGAGVVSATGADVLFRIPSEPAAAPVRRGFGAWLRGGGWLALTAGVLVAAGIAVGAFFLGKGGDMPPVDTGDMTATDTEQGSFEVTDEETAEDAEEDTQGGIHDETTGEDTAAPQEPRRIQFPLTKADDTDSYVTLPDMTSDEPRVMEFFVLPTDTENPALTRAFRVVLPAEGQANIQVVSFYDGKTYGLLYMLENVYTGSFNGIETQFVLMECTSLGFFTDKTMTASATRYYHTSGGGSAQLQYTAQQRQSMLARYRHSNQVALTHSENLIDQHSNPEKYEYTILYSYIDGVETVNTPVESIPAFPFTLFNEYGFDN
jgi:hypothetical protein